MGEKTITTQVKIDGEIVPDFTFDWEVEFQAEKYIMPLRIPQGSKGNDSLNSTIDLTFQHWAIYQLKRFNFTTIQQIAAGTYLPDEEDATVSLNLGDFCELFGQVLEYYYGGKITLDFNDYKKNPTTGWVYDDTATVVTISHTKIWNVLIDAFYNKFGVRWEIKPAADNSNTVKGGERYVIRVGYPTTEVDHIFEYGFEGGLLKVERQVQSEEIRNMLKGRGGDTNIPFRYFKNTDPNNKDFKPDPDWVEELKNIYFHNLMPATFRSYVQGWKAAHISKYPGYTAVGESNAYAPWAYRKGYTDTKFTPVEFVADDITINPTTGDRRVEILPGYSPYVKKGSSLDKYGPLPDTLDNNDDIYPTLQGTGLDIAVAVEQIESDDVAESTESDARVRTLDREVSAVKKVEKAKRAEIVIHSRDFTVKKGETANLDEGTKNIVLTKDKEKVVWHTDGKWGPHVETFQVPVENENVTIEDASLVVVNVATKQQISASGITSGTYYFKLTLTVYNTANETYNVFVECPEPKLTSATLDENKWRNTFDIWVKNIWNTQKGVAEDGTAITGETDAQYAERVWKPVLGDREGNAAKVVFTSGELAMSEDYEFTIVDYPVPDTSGTWTDESGTVHTSHWRIKLAKSDAELEATGLYVPSTKKQGKAGDTFVFIGTEMTHEPYVVDAEKRLDDWKKDQLREKKEIKPTFVVSTDRIRINQKDIYDPARLTYIIQESGGKVLTESNGGFVIENSGYCSLLESLTPGSTLRIADKRFISGAYETLYLQSIKYTYREPSSDDAALNPDVEIVLGNEYTISANPVSMIQGDISALQRQVGSISNVEQIVRAVGDRLYLRKDGISDRSISPTQFFSLLTSGDFRAGLVGGAGWGFYKDENGNWVIETDRVNVRQEMQVNNLVINQVTARGGMEVSTAAYMECTRVDDTSGGYICHFDQKDGSVANLFMVGDVAYCQRWNAEYDAKNPLKFYKRRVMAVSANTITLSKTVTNGDGIPEVGDIIIHFGSYTNAERQYVKVRDVVGGGYERYIEGLDSVNATGTEYYFIGRQAGQYGNKPRFYIGGTDSYVEWKEGKLTIKGEISAESTIGENGLPEYVRGLAGLRQNLLPGSEEIVVAANSGTDSKTTISLPFSVKEGDEFTLSAIGGITLLYPGTATGEQLYSVRIYGDEDGETIDGISNVEASAITSSRPVITFTITTAAEHPKLVLYAGKEGNSSGRSAKYSKVMLVKGAMEPSEWLPSIYNPDYLIKALQENTQISGGLILSSLIKLGYTSNGVHQVMSGLNGIYDSNKRGGGLSFWAGGDNIDKAESSDGAAFGVRHDGSAYAANNTVRFENNIVKVGKNVELTDDGLLMYDSEGKERLQISNTEVAGGFDDISDAQRVIEESTAMQVQLGIQTVKVIPGPGSSNPEVTTEEQIVVKQSASWEVAPSVLLLPPNASLRIGTLKIALSTLPVGLVDRPFAGRANVKIGYYNGATREYIRGPYVSTFESVGGYQWEASFNIPVIKTTREASQYFVEVTIPAGRPDSTSLQYNTTANGEVSGEIELAFGTKTVIGVDGFLTIWDKAGLLATKSGITARFDNYMLRISGSGIQKTIDGGKKWTTL